MKLTDYFVSQLEFEAAPTRKVLQRVPAERWGWKPHEKSTPMGALAQHIAVLPSWIVMTINSDELDVAPGGVPLRATPMGSLQEVLAALDTNVADATTALKGTDDAHLDELWTLLAAGHKVFSLPRRTVLQHSVFHHIAHHRAQLGVYLRLNDVPVPAIYGPTADEQ